MGKLQKDALAAYDRIKATRGEVTFLDAFIAGAEWQKQQPNDEAVKFAEYLAMETNEAERTSNDEGDLLHLYRKKYLTTQQLFEQFKKESK